MCQWMTNFICAAVPLLLVVPGCGERECSECDYWKEIANDSYDRGQRDAGHVDTTHEIAEPIAKIGDRVSVIKYGIIGGRVISVSDDNNHYEIEFYSSNDPSDKIHWEQVGPTRYLTIFPEHHIQVFRETESISHLNIGEETLPSSAGDSLCEDCLSREATDNELTAEDLKWDVEKAQKRLHERRLAAEDEQDE